MYSDTLSLYFVSEFNIHFGYPRTDTCSTCDRLSVTIDVTPPGEELYLGRNYHITITILVPAILVTSISTRKWLRVPRLLLFLLTKYLISCLCRWRVVDRTKFRRKIIKRHERHAIAAKYHTKCWSGTLSIQFTPRTTSRKSCGFKEESGSNKVMGGCDGLECDAARFRSRSTSALCPQDPSCKLCGASCEDALHFVSILVRLSLLSSAPPTSRRILKYSFW